MSILRIRAVAEAVDDARATGVAFGVRDAGAAVGAAAAATEGELPVPQAELTRAIDRVTAIKSNVPDVVRDDWAISSSSLRTLNP